MRQYYIHDGTKQSGPFAIDELRTLNINAKTSVWYEGLEGWTTADQVEELKNIYSHTPPPFAKQPPSFIPELPKVQKKSTPVWYYLVLGLILVAGAYYLLQPKDTSVTSSSAADTAALPQSTEAERKVDSFEQAAKEKQQRIQANTERNMNYRNNWDKYIAASIDHYEAVSLGGFKNVIVAIANKTEFPLDVVEVNVSFWTASKKLYRTETLSITDVSAVEGMAIKGPDCERGTYITIEIQKIIARKFNFCYNKYAADLMATDTSAIIGVSGNAKDPWRCQD